MTIKFNNKEVKKIYYGNTPVKRVYYGNKLIFGEKLVNYVEVDDTMFQATKDLNGDLTLVYIGSDPDVSIPQKTEVNIG